MRLVNFFVTVQPFALHRTGDVKKYVTPLRKNTKVSRLYTDVWYMSVKRCMNVKFILLVCCAFKFVFIK